MQRRTSNKRTISFRIDLDKVAALDKLAQTQSRERTFLLNEAVDTYLDVQHWQIEHIKEGIRQADAGLGADHAAVRAQWTRRLK